MRLSDNREPQVHYRKIAVLDKGFEFQIALLTNEKH